MNTLTKVVLGLGALVMLIGLVLLFTGDSIEDKLGEGIIYEGSEGEMKITGKSDSFIIESVSDNRSMAICH